MTLESSKVAFAPIGIGANERCMELGVDGFNGKPSSKLTAQTQMFWIEKVILNIGSNGIWI